MARRLEQEAIWFPEPAASLSLAAATPRLAEVVRKELPVIARLAATPGAGPQQAAEEIRRMIRELAPPTRSSSRCSHCATAWRRDGPRRPGAPTCGRFSMYSRGESPARPILLCLPADANLAVIDLLVETAVQSGIAGLIVDGSVKDDGSSGRLIGGPAREPALAQVRHWRSRFGEDLFLIGSGGVHEPADALALRTAGADLVEADSGVVYTGPGLPKRINDVLLFAELAKIQGRSSPDTDRPPERTWFWTMLMGAGMVFGGVLALLIAMMRVVLPYDESFLGCRGSNCRRSIPACSTSWLTIGSAWPAR